MEYIEKQKAVGLVRNKVGEYIALSGGVVSDILATTALQIDLIPSADVAPVRRTTYKYFNGYAVPRCVNCRCALSLEWVYCPECGALIDYDAPESGDRVED